jgi:hypothetical protein
MTHRHYGIAAAKPRPTYTGPTRAAARSVGAIVAAITASVIVLGFILYEVTKIVTQARVQKARRDGRALGTL